MINNKFIFCLMGEGNYVSPESELMKFTDGILKAKKAMRNLKTLQTSIMNFMLKWDVKFSRIS